MILSAEHPQNSRRTWFCPLNNHETAAEHDYIRWTNPKTTPEQPQNIILPAEQPRNTNKKATEHDFARGTTPKQPQNMILPAQ